MAVHTYADFSGGWYGSLDPAKVPDNMYDSRNMAVYRDGSIGPRPGLKAFNAGRVLHTQVYGLDTRRDLGDQEQSVLVFVMGVGVYTVDLDGTGADAQKQTGDLDGTPTAGFPVNLWHKSNFRTFIHVPGEGLYRFQQGQVEAMDISSATRVGTSSGVRILRDESGTSNLFYSAPSDPTTWDPLNFITISEDPGAAIANISELNNYVVIVLDYGGWYMLSGVPGINDVLRQVYQDLVAPAPWGMKAFVTTSENELYGLSPDNNYPVMFNGTKLQRLQYLSMHPDYPQASYATNLDVVQVSVVAIHSADTDSPCFILPDPENLMLTKVYGAWGLHEFDTDIDYAWTSVGGRIFGMTQPGILYPNMDVQIVTLGGAGLTSFTLTFGGQTTGALDDLETAANVEAALDGLSSVPTGEVAVSGASGGPYTVTFSGTLAGTALGLTATPTGGTGTAVVTLPNGNRVGGNPTGASVVSTDFTLNRPAFATDDYARPGDLSDTPVDAYMTLPEKWTESSDPVSVSEVVIDFVRYDTGAAGDNNITVTVTALARGSAGVTEQSQTKTWTAPGSESTADGVDDRVRFPFGNQSAGAGYRVHISDVRGVKIREVVVHDSDDDRSLRPF